MHRNAGALAGGVEARNNGVVVAEYLGLDVGRDSTHRVVRGWEYRNRLGVRLNAKVGAGKLSDVRELGVDYLWR